MVDVLFGDATKLVLRIFIALLLEGAHLLF